MKRRITLSIALALSVVLLSLMNSDSSVKAQQGGMRPIADTGIVPLGANQVLHLTIVGTGFGNNPDNLCFRQIEYGEGTCNGDGVCKQTIASQTTSAVITLMRGEGASFKSVTRPFADGVRVVVLSNRRDVPVNLSIINSLTGEVLSYQGDIGDGTGI